MRCYKYEFYDKKEVFIIYDKIQILFLNKLDAD